MSFFTNKTVSGNFKSGHSDLKKGYNNNVAKYYQNTQKKKKEKSYSKTNIWDLMVWCFDGKLYRATLCGCVCSVKYNILRYIYEKEFKKKW